MTTTHHTTIEGKIGEYDVRYSTETKIVVVMKNREYRMSLPLDEFHRLRTALNELDAAIKAVPADDHACECCICSVVGTEQPQ